MSLWDALLTRLQGNRAIGLARSRISFRPCVEQLEGRLAPTIQVTPGAGLITTEEFATATFSVVLTQKPTAAVMIRMRTTDQTEGRISPIGLTFNPMNWNRERVVTIRGVNDFVDDGDVAYQIVLDRVQSSDPYYHDNAWNDKNPVAVSVTNEDDDTAGLFAAPAAGLIINEGSTRLMTVRLTSQPTADVTVPIQNGVDDQGSVDAEVKPKELLFTPANWRVPKRVAITGVKDGFGNEPQDDLHEIVAGAAASTDSNYVGQMAKIVVIIHELRAPTKTTVISSVNPSVAGKEVTFTAKIQPPDGSNLVIPDGVVTFYINGRPVEAPLVNGEAKYTTLSPLSAGRHRVRVAYKGDSRFLGSSGQIIQVVQGPLRTPTPRWPKGTIATNTPRYIWDVVTGADFYDVKLTDVTTGQQVFLKERVVGTMLPPPVALELGHEYQWEIRALAENGNLSPWSRPTAFRVPDEIRSMTFEGDYKTEADATIILPIPAPPPPYINITTYRNFFSGTLTFSIRGDGSKYNPYDGTIAGKGEDFGHLLGQTQWGAPGVFVAPMAFGPAPITSSGRRIMVPEQGYSPPRGEAFWLPFNTYAGFTFSFDGDISADRSSITGMLTLNIEPSLGFGFNHPLTLKMQVVAKKR